MKNFFINFDKKYIREGYRHLSAEELITLCSDAECCKDCKNDPETIRTCCENDPCSYTVNDFPKFTYERIHAHLCEGDTVICFRTEIKNEDGIPQIELAARGESDQGLFRFPKLGDHSHGNRCTMLKADGCAHDFSKRPSCGITLVANYPSDCENAIDWDYCDTQWGQPDIQRIMQRIAEDFSGKTIAEIMKEISDKSLYEFISESVEI